MKKEYAAQILREMQPKFARYDKEHEQAIAIRMAIEALQERKTGQWIPDQLCKHKPSRIRNTDRWTIYHCSCCGHSNGRRFNDKFCPNCGAKMILKTQGGDSDV